VKVVKDLIRNKKEKKWKMKINLPLVGTDADGSTEVFLLERNGAGL